MKRHRIAVLPVCVILAFFAVNVAAQEPGAGSIGGKGSAQGSAKPSTPVAGTPAKGTAKPTTKSSSNTVQWADLVKGGKLPYGRSVTLAGQLSDLTCGTKRISDVLSITAITVSYLGQPSQATAATISGSRWTAPLGSLPADTAVNLQLKVTGNVSSAKRGEIIDDLLADAYFQRSLSLFLQNANGQSSAVFNLDAQIMLNGISDRSGPLTNILQNLLPSCAVATDVTAAAVKGLQVNSSTDLLGLAGRVSDVGKQVDKLDGYDPTMTAGQLDAFIKAKRGGYTKSGGQALTDNETAAVQQAADAFEKSYQSVLAAFGGDVIAQLSQGVVLSQSSTTQDLNKYAGFDAGALYAPRINELRGYYMVHIYPTGPVELDTSGHIPFWDHWSIAVGESTGDLSSNGASRVKSDKAFVYGLGFRLNKYFRVTAGGMLYRDSAGNRLLNEAFIGPSVDITALPGLKSVFASSSSKSTGSSPPAASNSNGSDASQ
jgi:hypothetical protein